MLSALELAGFKSFADKTRFDFPDGITVIVGPNGSGKSNVVDAIKWVLGAQSAKSLRGKDMVDVIFKGSTATGRKPANSAEATLVFDNRKQLLAVDAQEVQVTRRVYRSGESEYLLNNQACRLKDIKDLFRGTGVGVDAYSLIEQGKVDRMLQASPKDRRVIFEEAAGISRFNAKKAEAARRLERVDQNLCRLKDIVDEVRTRLNALKSQASKAQRFREMTGRLHELRLRLGWTEYSTLQDKAKAAESELAQLTDGHARKSEELAQARVEAQRAEQALHSVAERCQTVEAALQEAQQRIAVSQNQQESLRVRGEESRVEQTRAAARLKGLRQRVTALALEVETVNVQVASAQVAYQTAKQHAATTTAQAAHLRELLAHQNQQLAATRQRHLDLLRELSDKTAFKTRQESLLADLLQSLATAQQRLGENLSAEAACRKVAEQSATRLKQIQEQNSTLANELSAAQQELETSRTQLSAKQEEAAVLQGRCDGAGERLNILEQLEQHLEGVDSGARHVLELTRQSADPAFKSVLGLVAEMLEVDIDLAPLLDTALGETAHALVVSDGQLVQQLRNKQLEIPGRLTLIRLDRLPAKRFGEKIQLEGVRGVIGRADRMVEFREHVAPLMRYLLGTTWLVESLDVALELGHFRGANLRFVTADCQLMESDGRLTIGGLHASAALVSRRSELENTRAEIEHYKHQHQRCQAEVERMSGRVAKLVPLMRDLEQKSKELEKEFVHQQAAAQAAVARLDEIEQAVSKLTDLLTELAKQRADLEPAIATAAHEVQQLRLQTDQVEGELTELDANLRIKEADLTAADEEQTAARIELVRTEQRLEATTKTLEQAISSQQERVLAVEDARQEFDRLAERRRASELQILQLTSELAEDYLRCEAEDEQLDGLAAQAAELRAVRSLSAKRVDSLSRAIDKLSGQCQTHRSELERYHEASQTLLKRFAEDYSIDLDALSQAELIDDEQELKTLDAEAASLRQDIASVGEINMAALAELDELQSRYDFLNGQYEDLQAAKGSLQRIIHKINADSRRMFLETLEIVRDNFQKLYRKSFGGGNADIVLEDGEDVLECGIDIVATPPGKTALSNSLLSGGEKALTAVALLLAIFQYRPSPFCVLDEVDAPFDEANIGRFVTVLTEFLDWTKFIIVTHSKKTMTASTTLYGVTMQESGVSKQVAVRFEDVNEKGEIVTPGNSSSRAA